MADLAGATAARPGSPSELALKVGYPPCRVEVIGCGARTSNREPGGGNLFHRRPLMERRTLPARSLAGGLTERVCLLHRGLTEQAQREACAWRRHPHRAAIPRPAQTGSSRQRPSALSDGAAFARTGKAFAELGRAFLKFGRALRNDLAVASRPTAKRLRTLGGDAVQRLRDLDFSTAKLRADCAGGALRSRLVAGGASARAHGRHEIRAR